MSVDKEFLNEMSQMVKVPADLEETLKDLKVLGKGDIAKLIKLRARIVEKIKLE